MGVFCLTVMAAAANQQTIFKFTQCTGLNDKAKRAQNVLIARLSVLHSTFCLDLTLNSCLQRIYTVCAKVLIAEESTFLAYTLDNLYLQCPQFGKDIIKIKTGCFSVKHGVLVGLLKGLA